LDFVDRRNRSLGWSRLGWGLSQIGLGKRRDVGTILKRSVGDLLRMSRWRNEQGSSEPRENQLSTNDLANFHKAPRLMFCFSINRRVE